MKEPFVNLSDVINSTQSLSDLELKSYLANLSSAEQAALIAQSTDGAVSAVSANKAANFTNANNALLGADNSITSAAYYLLRTQDLTNLANDMYTVTSKQATEKTVNKNLADRQYEINEWSNSNKLDTLYFLQVLFITLTFIGTLLFLQKNGMIPTYLFGLFAFLALLFAVIVLIWRWRFTAVKRDGRYWNKQRWQQPS
jgi:hypothetical protein